MSSELNNKVALVTGASRGIGRAIALSLAEKGLQIYLAARDKNKLNETADLVQNAGGRAHIVELELTDKNSINAVLDTIKTVSGRLDILVNNAGITHSAAFAKTTTKAWEMCMAVNARAPFILCREALPLVKAAEKAFIINIASVVAIKGYKNQSAYTASKHALRGMSLSLAKELHGTNIRLHLICPGGVNTEMVSKVRPDIKNDELINPDEIAELVTYLVCHKGNAIIDELHLRREASDPWFIS